MKSQTKPYSDDSEEPEAGVTAQELQELVPGVRFDSEENPIFSGGGRLVLLILGQEMKQLKMTMFTQRRSMR